MTVKELIEKLQREDLNAKVTLNIIDCATVDLIEVYTDKNGVVTVLELKRG